MEILLIPIIAFIIVIFAIICAVFMSKKADVVFYEYEGVFGRPTGFMMAMTILALLGIVLFVVAVNGIGASDGAMAILTYIGMFIVLAGISAFLIFRARRRCPDDLKDGLAKALVIATMGMFGWWFKVGWNATMMIIALVPGFGWMSHFMITKDEKFKEDFVASAEEADARTAARWEQENREKREREEEERQRKEEEIQDHSKKVWNETGRTDVQYNSDGSRWKYSDEVSFDRRTTDKDV